MNEERSFNHAPVRLCCGKRHHGAICPDGLVQCCVCFDRVAQNLLNTDENGEKESLCKKCATEEAMKKKSKEKKQKECERCGKPCAHRTGCNDCSKMVCDNCLSSESDANNDPLCEWCF